jgi:hypothetical protein
MTLPQFRHRRRPYDRAGGRQSWILRSCSTRTTVGSPGAAVAVDSSRDCVPWGSLISEVVPTRIAAVDISGVRGVEESRESGVPGRIGGSFSERTSPDVDPDRGPREHCLEGLRSRCGGFCGEGAFGWVGSYLCSTRPIISKNKYLPRHINLHQISLR